MNANLRIVDLKVDCGFVPQYVHLRNRYCELLLTYPVNVQETKEWLASANIVVKGIVDGNSLLGAVLLYIDRGAEIAVFVGRKGDGVGVKLLITIEDAARIHGLSDIWAWVRQDNISAIRLFRKSGYLQQTETSRVYSSCAIKGYVFKKALCDRVR